MMSLMTGQYISLHSHNQYVLLLFRLSFTQLVAPSAGGPRAGFSGHKLIQLLLLIFDGTADAVSSIK